MKAHLAAMANRPERHAPGGCALRTPCTAYVPFLSLTTYSPVSPSRFRAQGERTTTRSCNCRERRASPALLRLPADAFVVQEGVQHGFVVHRGRGTRTLRSPPRR